MRWDYPGSFDEIWIRFNLIHRGNTAFWVANETDGIGYTGITNRLDSGDSLNSLGGYINNQYIGCVQNAIVQNVRQSYILHLKSGVVDGMFEVYLNSILLYTYTGNINNGHPLDKLHAYTEKETDNIFSDWYITGTASDGSTFVPEGEEQIEVLDTLNIKPREMHISLDWGGHKHTFFNGATQILRSRIRPKKIYELKTGGSKATLDYLLGFYNSHKGSYKPFIFNYDGVDEVCVFNEKLQIEECREVGNIVGFQGTIMLEALYDNTIPSGGSESDYMPLKPVGNVTECVDWDTNVLDMGANGRQQTYDSPIRTYSVKFSGNRRDRDKFLNFYRSHGNFMSFLFPYNGKDVEVVFPQTIEVDDKIEIPNIVGFECELDLTEIKHPNTGTYNELTPDSEPVRRVSLRDFTANGYYLSGKDADGICYKDCMERLSAFKITDCYEAFRGSDLTSIPYLDTSECQNFTRMFQDSNIEKCEELDTSNGVYFRGMFYNSKLKSIGTINFSKAKEIGATFSGSAIRMIDHVILGNQTKVRGLFDGAKNLSIVRYMDTSKLTSMENLFYNCSMLTSVPVIDMSNCTDASTMFYSCSALRVVRFSNTQKLYDVASMFSGCSVLNSVEGLNMTNAYVVDEWGNPYGIVNMFKNCYNLKSIVVMDDITYDDAKRKYRLWLTEFGLGDGRYNGRFLREIKVVTPSGVFTFSK